MRLASVFLLPLVLACTPRGKVTDAECTALVQKYFDLKAQDDPRLKSATGAERDEMIRKMKAELMATDPDMRQVTECKEALTRSEYECAIKAPTTQAWNTCIE
jgi:hypothetical protein